MIETLKEADEIQGQKEYVIEKVVLEFGQENDRNTNV